MEYLFVIDLFLILYFIAFIITKCNDRIYVSDVYYHCWRLIIVKYKLDGEGDPDLSKEQKLYDRVEPWIARHNMHFYRSRILISYETLANPLFPGQYVKYEYGMSASCLAAHILDGISKSDMYTNFPDKDYKEDRKFYQRFCRAFLYSVEY